MVPRSYVLGSTELCPQSSNKAPYLAVVAPQADPRGHREGLPDGPPDTMQRGWDHPSMAAEALRLFHLLNNGGP